MMDKDLMTPTEIIKMHWNLLQTVLNFYILKVFAIRDKQSTLQAQMMVSKILSSLTVL